ncbi:hypothetical protein AAG570_000576 [Ranatra chinensis]|uniref:Uncharacterized protein n=1 Tax=Ranatra chinensis TaxID=642074 RepID=A0ABD0YY71_9HEMI
MCCKYSYDRRHILTGGTDGVVRKYESRTTNLEREFVDHDIENDPNPVTAIIINPSRESPHFIATYVKGYVKLWHTKSGECLRTINENRQILNATHHPTSPKFLTMGDDGQLYLYDVETGQRERTFFDSYAPDRVEGHRSRVFAAKFNPKSVNEFISGGWDDTVQFWDIRKSQSCRYLSGAHVCGEGLDIDQKGEQV